MKRIIALNFMLLVLFSCSTNKMAVDILPSFLKELNKSYEVDNPIEIYTPFFDTESNFINTGKYDEEMKRGDLESLLYVEKHIYNKMESVPIETMYVLSSLFYNHGYKDKASYWFYTAQLYSKVFYEIMKDVAYLDITDHTFELSSSFDAFRELSGIWINGFAFGNIERLTYILKQVMKNDRALEYTSIYPDADFSTEIDIILIHNKKAHALSEFIEYIVDNKENIYSERKNSGIENVY